MPFFVFYVGGELAKLFVLAFPFIEYFMISDQGVSIHMVVLPILLPVLLCTVPFLLGSPLIIRGKIIYISSIGIASWSFSDVKSGFGLHLIDRLENWEQINLKYRWFIPIFSISIQQRDNMAANKGQPQISSDK